MNRTTPGAGDEGLARRRRTVLAAQKGGLDPSSSEEEEDRSSDSDASNLDLDSDHGRTSHQ